MSSTQAALSSESSSVHSLFDLIKSSTDRLTLIKDCIELIDKEVHVRGGLSGLAIKTAYHVVKKIKPTIMQEVMDHLLDGFVNQLDPIYHRFQTQSHTHESFANMMIAEKQQVALALLKNTDEKAENATQLTLKTAYLKLRPSAIQQVETSVPALAELIQRHIDRLN